MRILLVHNYYRAGQPGGEDVVFEQEKQLLESAGHEVATYTRSNDEMNERNPLDALRTVAGLVHSKRTRRELASHIARHRPDVAHFHNTFPLISASGYEACRAAAVPVVQTLHNFRFTCIAATHFRDGAVCEDCVPDNTAPAVRHRCYRGSTLASFAVARMQRRQWQLGTYQRLVDRFIALSQFARERFVRAGLPADKILVKENFVPNESMVAQSRAFAAKSDAHAVFVGRLSEEKGVRTLVEAWRSLRDLPLKIVGDGPLRGELAARAARDNLPIEFLGMQPRSEARSVLRAAWVQIVPSECFEQTPLAIPEAWAEGVPVIASRLGAMIETAGLDAPAASQFAAGDASDLARVVRALHRDVGTQQILIERGFARCREAYSPAASLAALERIYGELAAPRVAA